MRLKDSYDLEANIELHVSDYNKNKKNMVEVNRNIGPLEKNRKK